MASRAKKEDENKKKKICASFYLIQNSFFDVNGYVQSKNNVLIGNDYIMFLFCFIYTKDLIF